jgi:hypothetical protein
LGLGLQAHAQGDANRKNLSVDSNISARSDVNQAWMCGEGQCPASSGHPITGVRIFDGMSGVRYFWNVDPGQLYSIMKESCEFYAEAHSDGWYRNTRFDVCNPHVDITAGALGLWSFDYIVEGVAVSYYVENGQVYNGRSQIRSATPVVETVRLRFSEW